MSSPAASATDFRYQSSCVFAQNGIATSLSSQVADATEPGTTPSVTREARSAGTGARKPAWASSGAKTTSRLMMSIDSSPAARRRTSCSRWPSLVRGSWEVSIVYAPFAALVQRSAISAWPPESGLMYQVNAGVPPPPPLPQAARVDATTATVTAPPNLRRTPLLRPTMRELSTVYRLRWRGG